MAATTRIPPFIRRRSTQSVAAAVLVALLPDAANAAAAKVTFARGPVSAENSGGVSRELGRGAEIDAGDTIRTGTGRVQLRFTDGAFMSLKPNTEFRVDEYEFKGGKSGGQERGFFSLLRGGLRTITGLIGRARKASYRMRTPVATIGIRGTGYNLELLTSATGAQQLKWNVGDGSISVQLADGTWLTFSAGGSGSATREQFEQLLEALEQVAAEGGLEGVTADDLMQVFAASEQVDANGLSSLFSALQVTRAPPPDCASVPTGCAIAAAFGFGTGFREKGVIFDGGEGLLATFDTNGALASYRTTGPGSLGLEVRSTDGGEGFAEIGNRGTAGAVVDGTAYFSIDPNDPQDPRAIATWGRWIAPGTTSGEVPHPQTLTGGDTFAYVISIPPPATPTSGVGTFSLNGFTPPAVNGPGAAALGAAGVVTGTLTADFGNARVGVNMNVPFANGAYQVQDSNGLGMFSNFGFAGSGNPYFKGNLTVNGTGVACVEGCAGVASGNVFGPRADGAALGYQLHDSNVSSVVSGAAVFKQTSFNAGAP